MFRLDPKQAVLDHVARKSAGQGELSAEAKAIAQAPIEPSYSAAVIIGIAQAIEGLLLATLGFAIFASYVEPGQTLRAPDPLMGDTVRPPSAAVRRVSHGVQRHHHGRDDHQAGAGDFLGRVRRLLSGPGRSRLGSCVESAGNQLAVT